MATLVVSLQGVGNLVMATPTIRALADAGHDVRLIVQSRAAAELLEPAPWIASVSCLDELRGGSLVAGWRMRGGRFGRVVSCYPNGRRAAVLTLAVGAAERAGFAELVPPWLRSAYNKPVRIAAGLHDVEQNARLLDALGLERPMDLEPCVYLTDADRTFAQGFLAGAGFDGDRPIVALHPGCAVTGLFRRWPEASFTKLVERLRGEPDLGVVLVGDAGERPILERIAGHAPPGVAIAAGGMRIRQMAAIIERCQLLVGNDSGPLHLAAALGVPAVGLYGPTDETRTGPWGRQHTVLKADISCRPCYSFGREFSCEHESVKCLELVGVDSVLDAVRGKLTSQLTGGVW